MSYYCPTCYGQGVIWTKLKDQTECNGLFVFLCSCAWGNADRRNYPKWNKNFERVYAIDRRPGTPEPKALPGQGVQNTNVKPYHPKTFVSASPVSEDDLF
jgi:hypothetical protein